MICNNLKPKQKNIRVFLVKNSFSLLSSFFFSSLSFLFYFLFFNFFLIFSSNNLIAESSYIKQCYELMSGKTEPSLVLTKKDGKLGLTRSGEILVENNYDGIFSTGLQNFHILKKDGKYGIVETSQHTHMVLPVEYDWVSVVKKTWSSYLYDIVLGKDGYYAYFMDDTGRGISFNYSELKPPKFVIFKKDGKLGLLRMENNNHSSILLDLEYDSIRIIDKRIDDSLVFEGKSLSIDVPLDTRYFIIKKDGKYGLIDEYGKTIIDIGADSIFYYPNLSFKYRQFYDGLYYKNFILKSILSVFNDHLFLRSVLEDSGDLGKVFIVIKNKKVYKISV